MWDPRHIGEVEGTLGCPCLGVLSWDLILSWDPGSWGGPVGLGGVDGGVGGGKDSVVVAYNTLK